MRTISAALAAHAAGESTTLATLWKVTRADGQIFGFTDHDQDLTVSALVYQAETGYTRSALRASLGLAADNLEVQGAFDSASITAADIRAGKWDHAVVEIVLVNWADVSMGTLAMAKGKLGEVKGGRSAFTAELLGLAKHLQQPVGRLYLAACNADLGDARCAVTLATYTVAGTVTGVTSKRVFADSARGQANGYFDGGKVSWTSGNNAGLKMEVKTFLNAGGAFTLQLPMPASIQVGDAYSVHAGCDKSVATCGSKFTNTPNFRGFPHVPGIRRLLNGGL